MKSLPDQLACAKRELALRKNVYPRWVQERRKDWTADKMRHEIECMEAIVGTLEKAVGLDEAVQELRLDYPEGKKPATGWDKVREALGQ